MTAVPSNIVKPNANSVTVPSSDKPGVAVPKTSTTAETSGTVFTPSTEKNVLYNYRSWTYNFALGYITADTHNSGDINLIASDLKKFIVLNSAGKGTPGLNPLNVISNTSANKTDTQNLINGFNKYSAGKFDMYIDEINIESIIGAANPQSGASQPTSIEFTVIEPYSILGFIESLQIAAQAAGYDSFNHEGLVLRIQFQGYPSTTDSFSVPEIIPDTIRYFPFVINNIEVDVTEDGTRYHVTGTPSAQIGFGTPNQLTNDIKVAGNTVEEVLKNFFIGLNQMAQDDAKEEKGDIKFSNKYEISCPLLSTPLAPQNVSKAILYSPTRNGDSSFQNTRMISAKMNKELKDNNVFKHADPGQFRGYVGSKLAGSSTSTGTTADPSTGKLVPTEGTVVFAAGTQIHDCIAAVLRDSEYIRDDLLKKQLDEAKKGDGYVTYFTVRMERDIGEFDVYSNKYLSTYRYILEPYRILYNRIPGQSQGDVDHSSVISQIKREYDYIYTGKNLDINKFQLKFNNLFFEAISAKAGNKPDTAAPTQSASASNLNQLNVPKSEAAKKSLNNKNYQQQLPTSPIHNDPNQNTHQLGGAVAGQPQSDPYYKLSQSLHEAIMGNHAVDLIQGTLDILGDPYFLISNGMSNGNLQLSNHMKTTDNQAPVTQGDLFLNINFRNPTDNNDPNNPGFALFNPMLLPFSGVYRIVSLKSHFKDGVFTQELEIIRSAGQIIDNNQLSTPPGSMITSKSPVPASQIVQDTAPATVNKEGIRPNDLNLSNLANRGLPNNGLPGVNSNFTDALTGLPNGILTQVNGVTGEFNVLTNQLGVSPLGGINPLNDGIKLSPSTLGSLASTPNLSAAAISAAGNIVKGLTNISDAGTKLAENISEQLLNLSGVVPSTPANSSLAQTVSNLTGRNISNLVGNAANAVSSLQNPIPTDILAVGSKLGIDPSVISGLSPSLASKVTKDLTSIAEAVPENSSLNDLENQGVFFAKMTNSNLPNLPPVQPSVSTPLPVPDPALMSVVVQNGTVDALLNGNANLPALTNINNVSNPLGGLTAGLLNGAGSAQGILGQVQSVQTQLNGVLSSKVGVSNPVGSLNQNSVGIINPASVGLGSVESNIITNNSIVQAVSNNPIGKLSNSVVSTFGSNQQTSPLAKLIKNSNIQGST